MRAVYLVGFCSLKTDSTDLPAAPEETGPDSGQRLQKQPRETHVDAEAGLGVKVAALAGQRPVLLIHVIAHVLQDLAHLLVDSGHLRL